MRIGVKRGQQLTYEKKWLDTLYGMKNTYKKQGWTDIAGTTVVIVAKETTPVSNEWLARQLNMGTRNAMNNNISVLNLRNKGKHGTVR